MGGITYVHEHVTIDLSGVKKDDDCRLDHLEDTLQEFAALKAAGVVNVIDVTTPGMGRNIDYVAKVEALSGIHILSATGFYKEPFLPPEVYELSEAQLAKNMVKEITDGIGESGIKASVIGEIGTGKGQMSQAEKKVFISAARAHNETGIPITTHTTLGLLAMEQIELLKNWGVDLERVVIGHVDLSQDVEYVLRLLDQGVYVAFDTVGKKNYVPDEIRGQMLKNLCDRGFASRVMLSMDITRKSHLKCNGGLGYSYLLAEFVPYLQQQGITTETCEQMLVHNPRTVFGKGVKAE